VDSGSAAVADEQARLDAFTSARRERRRAVADPESEVYPDDW